LALFVWLGNQHGELGCSGTTTAWKQGVTFDKVPQGVVHRSAKVGDVSRTIALVKGSLSELQQAIFHPALKKHFFGTSQGLQLATLEIQFEKIDVPDRIVRAVEV
jgi:hypothetical protein